MESIFPSIWIVFGIILWEGLLGGLVYVNTFAEISEDKGILEKGEREFSLGAVSVSDSGGILLAGILGLGVEKGICEWQVRRGRGWCREG